MEPSKGFTLIKTIYFYLVSFVALLMIVLPTASLINLGVRQFIFQVDTHDYYPSPRFLPEGKDAKSVEVSPEEEKQRFTQQQRNNMKRDVARDVSFLIVGIPLFLLNWRLIKRNKMAE